jgi:hypothetical protein
MTLQEQLDAARIAYHNLMVGKSVREVMDQNGERIIYTAANADRLKAYISSLETQIAGATVVNRPLIPVF